ncbi:hypothetical protein N0V84_001240 [Fusarium piperis]|uniref:Uncharacterized protein n=1 Tax=Fusarium piperis TaxID=1435070 RepID=A0A9W9BTJ7_9HYPO|nr:hypothetical protein N0V84_001240 [Fusarium piperis]
MDTYGLFERDWFSFVISWRSDRKWCLGFHIHRIAISSNRSQERDDWFHPVLIWWWSLGFSLDDNDGNTNSWFLEPDSICCVLLRRGFWPGRIKLDVDDGDWNTKANDIWLLEQYSVALVIFWGNSKPEPFEYYT